MTDKSTQLISLLNFDPRSQREPIINSPRSLEACRRQGIDPKELVIRTAADLREQYKKKNLDKEGLEMMLEHYEERRMDKIRILIEERAQLIEDEKNGYSIVPKGKEVKQNVSAAQLTKSNIQALLQAKTDSTLIEKEKKQFEKIKQKQEKEIRQLIEYENKMNEIREKNEQRLAEEREKARLEELQKEQARKEAAEKKRLLELEKHRKLAEEEEMRRQMALETKKKDDAKMAWEQEKLRRKQAEIKMKEEEQRKKHEEFLKELENKALEKQQEIYERKREIERQEKLRQEQLEQQRLEKKREIEEKKRLEEERIRWAQEKNNEILAKRKMDYDSKQEKNEEKRRQFELERQQRLEENRRAAELYAENIQRVMQENEKIQNEKKEKYTSKRAQLEARQRELELQRELEKLRKEEEDRKREEARLQVKENMENMVKEKVEKYLEMREETEKKLTKIQREKEEELKRKQQIDLIQQSDKMENIQRKAKMDEYKRQKLLEKIQEDNDRAEKIKNDKATLMEMRQMVKREVQLNKESLNEKFELMKKGKISSLDETRSRYAQTPKTAMIQKANSPSPGPRSVKGGTAQSVEGLPRTRTPKRPEKSLQHPAEAKVKALSDEEIKRGLDELKAKHNQIMLKLLEDEHLKEKQREEKLKTIKDPEEKRKFEKETWSEKERSHLKIRQVTDSQNEAIKQYMLRNSTKILG